MNHAGGLELVGQPVGEAARLYLEVVFQVRRRNRHTEVARAGLARAEVAHERQERPQLTAGEPEVRSVQAGPTGAGAEPLDRVQVVAPVPATDGEAREPRARQEPAGRLGLEERPERHVRGQPPGGRAEADEVVGAIGNDIGDAYLTGRTTQL